ncbi:MAG: acetoacetate decarboxylase family protein [Cellulomonadaceae bacterium]|nr:acetoacetate decarboxylase family protein [Cellulomonadaceae bacterium]
MNSYRMTDEEVLAMRAPGSTLDDGLKMEREEGIFVTWITDPEKVQAIIPPPLTMVAPAVTTYIVNIDGTNFGPAYREAALLVPVSYEGTVGMYLVSLFVQGLGAEQAALLGREMAGLPKKFADTVRVDRIEDTVHAYAERGGVRVVDVTARIGEYNTPDALQIFGGNTAGARVPGESFFFKVDLDQIEDGSLQFTRGRLTQATSATVYDEWLPSLGFSPGEALSAAFSECTGQDVTALFRACGWDADPERVAPMRSDLFASESPLP